MIDERKDEDVDEDDEGDPGTDAPDDPRVARKRYENAEALLEQLVLATQQALRHSLYRDRVAEKEALQVASTIVKRFTACLGECIRARDDVDLDPRRRTRRRPRTHGR